MVGILFNPKNLFNSMEGVFSAEKFAVGLHGANRLVGNSLAEIIISINVQI